MENIEGHIFLSKHTNKKLFGEYVYYLLTQRGGFSNINKKLRDYILEKLKNRNDNKSKKDLFLNSLELEDFNFLFKEHLKDKLSSKKRRFDSYTLPSVITSDQFKNRSPVDIKQEKIDDSYILIKDILEKGFPVVAKGNILYVFYIKNNVPYDIYQRFYEEKDNLSHSTKISLGPKREVKLSFLEDRDYFNTLLFLYSIIGIIHEQGMPPVELNDIIVWKRSEGSGSIFEISDLDYVIKLLGYGKKEKVYETNFAKTLGYIYNLMYDLKRLDMNENVIKKILDEFSYYLLIKHTLDYNAINQIVSITVDLYGKEKDIRFLNKIFIIKFMDEVTNYKYLDEYFELGQKLRSAIYSLVSDFDEAEKIIDLLAKDLRNELLPEYFIETLERDLVWLKGLGFKFSEELSKKFAKLTFDLKTSDLSMFYLIKASIILGLLSPTIKNSDINI